MSFFDTSFEDLAVGTRTDNEGGTAGHGIVQNTVVHSGSKAWHLWGIKDRQWIAMTTLQCLGGLFHTQIKTLQDVTNAGLLATDSAIGTMQFEDGGNGYPKLIMRNADGSYPIDPTTGGPWQGPDVPNDGKYHWTVSNGYPRGRIGVGYNIPAISDDIYLRVHFLLTRLDGYVQILRLYSASGDSAGGYICMVSVSRGQITLEGVGGEFYYPTTVSLNQWHYLEMHFKRSTINQGVKQVWFDNPNIPVLDKQNLNTSAAVGAGDYTPLTGLVLCGTYPNMELDFYVDNFAASTTKIGPAPAGTQALLSIRASPYDVKPIVVDSSEYVDGTPLDLTVPVGNHSVTVPSEVIV